MRPFDHLSVACTRVRRQTAKFHTRARLAGRRWRSFYTPIAAATALAFPEHELTWSDARAEREHCPFRVAVGPHAEHVGHVEPFGGLGRAVATVHWTHRRYDHGLHVCADLR